MTNLKLALVHLSIDHKQPEKNLQSLLSHITEAGRQGAKFVVAPELSVSGYSFKKRTDLLPYAETANGPALTAVAEAAQAEGLYVCIGLAEKDEQTGILYNSAFVLGPKGDQICRYRKINAEARWGCSGPPKQNNVFETPWGKVGVLICSDIYHGLLPRVTALRGADLLICPSNWPSLGIDPRKVWSARAMENGFYLVTCNRTGLDQTMDCRESLSCVFDPWGQKLLEGQNEDSQVFYIELPLDDRGRLDDSIRKKCLVDRRPQNYYDCYINLQSILDLTSFLELPDPGLLNIHCLVPERGQHPLDSLKQTSSHNGYLADGLYILPDFEYSESSLDQIDLIAKEAKIHIVTCNQKDNGQRYYAFGLEEPFLKWQMPSSPSDMATEFPCLDFGPARVALLPFQGLKHPELAVALSKQGHDLAVAFDKEFTSDNCLLSGLRTIEHISIALSTINGAGMWFPPEGHQEWTEITINPGSIGSYSLDSHRTRRNKFQDRIDFDTLFQ